MRGQYKAQRKSEKKNFWAKKEFAAMIGEVTKQLFAKMTPIKKRQMMPEFPAPNTNKELVAAFENTSIESLDSLVTGAVGKDSSSSTGSTTSNNRDHCMLSLDTGSK